MRIDCHSGCMTCEKIYFMTPDPSEAQSVHTHGCAPEEPGPEIIKLLFVLNLAEHEISPPNKSQIASNCKIFLAKYISERKISSNKYANANYCWHFYIY